MMSVNQLAMNGSNVLDPEVAANLTPKQRDMVIYGSKMTLVLEIFTLTCIWSVKACLLVLHYCLSCIAPPTNSETVLLLNSTRYTDRACPEPPCASSRSLCSLSPGTVSSPTTSPSACFSANWCHPIYEYWALPVNFCACPFCPCIIDKNMSGDHHADRTDAD